MTTLAQIRTKVRRVTKSPSTNQLTDAEIDSYVNTFYLYDFPEHLRLINLKETFNLVLEPDIDIYIFTPNTNISIEPPAYIGGLEIRFYQSKQEYFTIYPEIQRNVTLATGDGTAGPYAGTITATPIKRNRVLLTTVDVNGDALSAQDTTVGTFTGDVVAGSTIDYTSGAIAAVTWNTAIPNGTNIQVQSVNYQRARPQGVLFYNDTLQFSPVPDQGYEFEITAFVTPTALANSTDEPELREWWQLLALGAALKIFGDRLDIESYKKTKIFYDEQQNLVERRTMKQLSPSRVSTIYTDDFSFVTPFSSGS